MKKEFCKYRKQVGINITELRERAGLTIEDLATLLEIGPQKLQRIEAGTINATVSILQKLKKALGCTYAEILQQ